MGNLLNVDFESSAENINSTSITIRTICRDYSEFALASWKFSKSKQYRMILLMDKINSPKSQDFIEENLDIDFKSLH